LGWTTVKRVSLFLVAMEMRVPDLGLSLPSAQPSSRPATTGSGVQSSKLAPGIDLRLVGVSRQMGRMPSTDESLGRPLPAGTKLAMRWCVAA
jgi:hypothetical protein